MPKPSFTLETTSLLDRAETICERRGSRLTELRRHVLGLVLDSPKPTGAYDMLDRLRQNHQGAAPPTIYRALDFLLEQGLIHKVERISAFLGCVHGIDDEEDAAHHHAAQFLICKRCHRVTELNEKEIGQALVRAARRVGFHLGGATVEAEGICSDCSAQV